MSETSLLRSIISTYSRGLTRLFRNNVGALQAPDGRYVRFGLCEGSSDIIGWRSVTITLEMVGKQIAVFVALETKSARGSVRLEQRNFLSLLRAHGGIGEVIRTHEQAETALEFRRVHRIYDAE